MQYAYDNAGNLATVTDPEGGVTRYGYDGNNRLTTITDPQGIMFLQNFLAPAGACYDRCRPTGANTVSATN